MNSQRQGFTLLELIVVIAVIGILAAITIIGFSRYQQDTRDTRRASSIAVITEALEKYYDENGEYPNCDDISVPGSTLASSTLRGIDQSTLVAPAAPDDTTNSLQCEELTLNGQDFFEYEGDGSDACVSGGACLQYTLKYKEEGSGTIKTVESRRTTSIATSGVISNLSAFAQGPTSIGLTWAAVPNATNYTLQRSLDNTFTDADPTSTETGTSTSVGSLETGTQYFFRIRPNAGNSQGTWSNTANATTTSPTSPNITATTASSTAINVTWADVAYEDSYKLEYSTNNFSSVAGTINLAANTTSRQVSSLTTGQVYYFRLTAIKTGDYSVESNVASATPIAQASISSTSASACGQVTVNWSSLSGASTYTVRHSANSNMSSATSITGVTGTSRVVTGLPQGATRYFTVAGVTAGGYTGQASSTASRVTTICPPAAYSVSSSTGTGLTATSNATCAAGTTRNYYWYANGSPWVSGDQHQSVTYSLGYGQGVTLSVNTRCYNGTGNSSYTAGNNSPSYTRPGLIIQGIQKITGGSSNGHRVHTWWNNLCGGSNQIIGYQGGYNTGWISPNWSATNNPATGGVPTPSSTNDARNWFSAGNVTMYARQDCGGWQQSSNSATIYA